MLIPLLIIPAHSEDYGAGLLFIGLFTISLFGGLVLCGIGAATLIVNRSSDGSARTMMSKVAAALGAIRFLAFLGYVWFFFTA